MALQLIRQAARRQWIVLTTALFALALLLGWQNGLGRLDQTLYDAAIVAHPRASNEDVLAILSAKEITKGFGLGGVKSIEITAAYSENILKQKQYVQSKMPVNDKNRFDQMSARMQKETMTKSIEQKLIRAQAAAAPMKPATSGLWMPRRRAR